MAGHHSTVGDCQAAKNSKANYSQDIEGYTANLFVMNDNSVVFKRLTGKTSFMKIYSSTTDAISDLHKQGFTNDFHLVGNDLLWVQGKLFIRAGEFSILEYLKINDSQNAMNEVVVFGIIAPYHKIKGILLDHYKSYTNVTPPVLVKKLNELGSQLR